MRKLTLCAQNISAFTIVLPTPFDPAEKTAAEFLQRVISVSCGVTLPISHARTEHSIVIGGHDNDPQIKWDGFRTVTDDDHLYLYGNLARGTLYAAYNFAEKYLGHRYFSIGCEKIPTEGEAKVPAHLDIVDNPAFGVRRTDCWTHIRSAEFSAHSRLNDCMPVGEEYGGGVNLPSACHTFSHILPPDQYFDEHPEYFALHNGIRAPFDEDHSPSQLCLTNPDVIRIVTEKVLDYLRKNPNEQIVELSQNDNGDYCTCERCAAIDAEEESQSGTMIRFVNAVAEEVEKEFPNVLIRTFAYWYTQKPPKYTRARKNVLIRFCTMHACCRHAIDDPNCKVNREQFYPDFFGWKEKSDQLSIWDYIVCYRSYIPPFPNLYSLRENARFFAEQGAIHLFEEDDPSSPAGGTTPELKAYLAGMLLWNPSISLDDYNARIDEFLEAFYGKGWRYIRQYMDIEYEETADRCIECMGLCETGRYSYANYYPQPYQEIIPNNYLSSLAARYDELMDLVAHAYALAETDEQRYRIDGIRLSLQYMEITCVEHNKSKMTAEEQAAHEESVRKFEEEKTARRWRYNTSTNHHQGR